MNSSTTHRIDPRKEPEQPNDILNEEFLSESVTQENVKEQSTSNALQEFAESSEFRREQSPSKLEKQDEISFADEFNFDLQNNQDLIE